MGPLVRQRLGILMVPNWNSALERFNYVTLICFIHLFSLPASVVAISLSQNLFLARNNDV